MELTTIFLAVSLKFSLPPKLLESLCYVESKHTISSISIADGKSDSYGICQVKLETAQFLGFKGSFKDLLKPEVNIFYAGKYLNYQRMKYYDITKALVAYNRGNSLNKTRSEYSDKVLKRWKEIRWMPKKTRH